jgi:hypothetical protein
MALWDEFVERKGIARTTRHVSEVVVILLGERLIRWVVGVDDTFFSHAIVSMLNWVELLSIAAISVMFLGTLFRELKKFFWSNGASHLVALGL